MNDVQRAVGGTGLGLERRSYYVATRPAELGSRTSSFEAAGAAPERFRSGEHFKRVASRRYTGEVLDVPERPLLRRPFDP
jgi:hypothetical protein